MFSRRYTYRLHESDKDIFLDLDAVYRKLMRMSTVVYGVRGFIVRTPSHSENKQINRKLFQTSNKKPSQRFRSTRSARQAALIVPALCHRKIAVFDQKWDADGKSASASMNNLYS